MLIRLLIELRDSEEKPAHPIPQYDDPTGVMLFRAYQMRLDTSGIRAYFLHRANHLG